MLTLASAPQNKFNTLLETVHIYPIEICKNSRKGWCTDNKGLHVAKICESGVMRKQQNILNTFQYITISVKRFLFASSCLPIAWYTVLAWRVLDICLPDSWQVLAKHSTKHLTSNGQETVNLSVDICLGFAWYLLGSACQMLCTAWQVIDPGEASQL